MKKETWIVHIEEISGLTRPSVRPDTAGQWVAFVKAHKDGCKLCKERAKTKKANQKRKLTDSVYQSLG